jgi:F-type H+-transporting ATPase subunit b
MKTRKVLLTAMIVMMLCLAPVLAGAQDEAGPGTFRQIWDISWRIINFFILVFLIVKFGRQPLMKFLRGHGQDIGERLDRNKALLEEAKAEYAETEKRLGEMESMIGDIQAYMQEEAQRARDRIIADAEKASETILSDARERAETEIRRAWAKVKNELVEQAVCEAERSSDQDQRRGRDRIVRK